LAPDLPETIVGDSDRLSQVLINLIGNAVKFTREGEVRVCVQPRGDFVEFAVADTGIGIPEEKRELLFESFTQADSSFTRKFGGTGLGLAISKGLVDLMGGEISVRGRKDRGVSLPLPSL
jgi:signal transduction histidine kinase